MSKFTKDEKQAMELLKRVKGFWREVRNWGPIIIVILLILNISITFILFSKVINIDQWLSQKFEEINTDNKGLKDDLAWANGQLFSINAKSKPSVSELEQKVIFRQPFYSPKRLVNKVQAKQTIAIILTEAKNLISDVSVQISKIELFPQFFEDIIITRDRSKEGYFGEDYLEWHFQWQEFVAESKDPIEVKKHIYSEFQGEKTMKHNPILITYYQYGIKKLLLIVEGYLGGYGE